MTMHGSGNVQELGEEAAAHLYGTNATRGQIE